MLFHTWIFALFFLIFYPVFLLVRRTRFKDVWLLAASYVFYGWWSPFYLVLIIYSTLIDYFAVSLMAKTPSRPRRKLWLVLTVVNHLLLLGLFKYGNFVIDNVNIILAWTGLAYSIAPMGLLLPVGISFYTFQAMSYTIDFYRGRIDREPSLVRFATFVALFPQLVAGPIERASNLLPQLARPSRITRRDICDGLGLFVVGLFKKLALADYLALYVDKVYASPGDYHAPALVLATLAFGWQIFFDFSGYTDMARGIGRLMGLHLMENFRSPYLATGFGDFWRRWHISLSTWFRDYVYIPLGGNRKGAFKMYCFLFITMVVSGLWHGAAWTFVTWGALHAAALMLGRKVERSFFYQNRIPRAIKLIAVYAFVNFAWIFFRADSVQSAWVIVRRIFVSGAADPRFPLLAGLLVAAVWAYQYVSESAFSKVLTLAPVRMGVVAAMVLYMMVFAQGQSQPFYYFQF
ncbi:MAG: MBOAT family protein [Planctomycetes bacterium]|nr:MBOAT family protein [Planctomycetota bacterium]